MVKSSFALVGLAWFAVASNSRIVFAFMAGVAIGLISLSFMRGGSGFFVFAFMGLVDGEGFLSCLTGLAAGMEGGTAGKAVFGRVFNGVSVGLFVFE